MFSSFVPLLVHHKNFNAMFLRVENSKESLCDFLSFPRHSQISGIELEIHHRVGKGHAQSLRSSTLLTHDSSPETTTVAFQCQPCCGVLIRDRGLMSILGEKKSRQSKERPSVCERYSDLIFSSPLFFFSSIDFSCHEKPVIMGRCDHENKVPPISFYGSRN